MQHAILELECRKHVQELHISHANKAVFGPTKGPQKSHYKRFKETWSTLKLYKDNMFFFDWEEFSDTQSPYLGTVVYGQGNISQR